MRRLSIIAALVLAACTEAPTTHTSRHTVADTATTTTATTTTATHGPVDTGDAPETSYGYADPCAGNPATPWPVCDVRTCVTDCWSDSEYTSPLGWLGSLDEILSGDSNYYDGPCDRFIDDTAAWSGVCE